MNSTADLFFGRIACALVFFFMWLIGIHSRVELRENAVVLVNMVFRSEIPFSAVSGFGDKGSGFLLTLGAMGSSHLSIFLSPCSVKYLGTECTGKS